jgi:hypothetical protein
MDRAKFKELLLYVASRLLGDPSFGSVKLNKVLFFSDVVHYASYGNSITGATYVRHRRGPAPKGLTEIQQELVRDGDADLAVLQNGRRVQKILFPKRLADIGGFTGQEIETVGLVLKAFKDHTAEEMSELSHQMDGWQIAPMLAEIPYEAIFLYHGPVTDDDVEAGRQLAKTLNKELASAGITPIDAAYAA